ncbi:hypothetical protein QJU89_04475 [Pasteurella skyensis]|uniref:Uncharacterized protein n=1 Tax=Phocoenobacter skyensis TaxID=97481 RepID=A0AAJ6N956_9PAST|nr:hypothetical protein [Pasteurella skyensis]MDP8162540.1 hypothetical protein [Pasteurella skyensis]MDP8172505.1 hypothetical protein [Pasteurella skyensis]MDP8177530.1 hypothetical protein [Pasteurella skyensis]MDP8178760.1 hypothetical protein [Pasteurella skyensis]MDP8182950.1 hypothetical protein [Pasteurella skyensis]
MNFDKAKDYLNELLRNPKPTEMLIVYFSSYGDNHNCGIHPALIPIDQKEDILLDYGWDLRHEEGLPENIAYCSNGEKKIEYLRFGNDRGIEPLVICRNFHGIREDYIEISEEFRLYHNLYYDAKNNTYIKIESDGSETTIIEVSKDQVKIRVKELKQFLAVKDMFLSIQFDYRIDSNLSLEELNKEQNLEEYKNDLSIWSIGYGDFNGFSCNGYKSFVRFTGKKLIFPFDKSKKKSSIKDEYIDFIIDVNDDGEEILFNSNPGLLGNYFGANPNNPDYLTPVYFDKEVLSKYYNLPSKYSVEDSYLRCGTLWGLQMDNHHQDMICVWLGDLGRDLPYKEQLHWRSYNILPKGKVSNTFVKRQLLAEPTDSEEIDHIFKIKYQKLLSQNNDGWLLPLKQNDQHHLASLKLPLTNEQKEFDELVLSLTKILVDSLNEKFLNSYLDKQDVESLKGSISKLEFVLDKLNLENFEEHIQFLRTLQGLRSSSSAHRKGRNYEKISKTLDIENKDLITIFTEILSKATELLDYFLNIK